MASAHVRLVSMVVLAFCFSVTVSTQQTFNIIRSSPGRHAEVIICIFRREYAQLLLVNRSPASLKRRLPAPLRQQRVDWSKHGYMCRSPPDFHPDIVITISMDISQNPGPQQWNDSLRVLYLNTRGFPWRLCKEDTQNFAFTAACLRRGLWCYLTLRDVA